MIYMTKNLINEEDLDKELCKELENMLEEERNKYLDNFNEYINKNGGVFHSFLDKKEIQEVKKYILTRIHQYYKTFGKNWEKYMQKPIHSKNKLENITKENPMKKYYEIDIKLYENKDNFRDKMFKEYKKLLGI